MSKPEPIKNKIIKELWELLNLEKRLTKLEQKIQKIEIKLGVGKVPCQINEGEFCDEPYCKFVFYEKLSRKYYDEWINKIRGVVE